MIEPAPAKEGLKKELTEIFRKYKLLPLDIAIGQTGQIVAHINNSAVSKVCFDNWEVK